MQLQEIKDEWLEEISRLKSGQMVDLFTGSFESGFEVHRINDRLVVFYFNDSDPIYDGIYKIEEQFTHKIDQVVLNNLVDHLLNDFT